MKIKKVVLRELELKHKVGFRTSFGVSTVKNFSVIEVHDSDGNVGYGECSPFFRPWYNEETTGGAIIILKNFLIPELFNFGEFKTPEDFWFHTGWIRRNRMARSAVDCALWELYSKQQGLPEWKALGGVKTEVEAGISLGIEKTPDDLCRKVEESLKKGYHRVKCKIGPGHDIQYLSAVRKQFGDIIPSFEDYAKAVGYYQQAAELNDPYGQYALAHCYQNGLGVSANPEKALAGFEKARSWNIPSINEASQPMVDECYGQVLEKTSDPAKARSFIESASKKGHRAAQYHMGRILRDQDHKDNLAAKWFDSSAQQGYAPAMVALADCYRDGRGYKKDLDKARQLYNQAVAAGNTEAQSRLDEMDKKNKKK